MGRTIRNNQIKNLTTRKSSISDISVNSYLSEISIMPRRNKKSGKGRHGDSNSDDESCIDNQSVDSFVSDNASSSVHEAEDDGSSERYEDKFLQALENATEKSTQTRTLALQNLCQIMTHRYMPDFVNERKITLVDCIEKSIRRGKGAEQSHAVRLVQLLVVQLGGDEIVCKPLQAILLTAVQDKTVSFDARAKCCAALSLMYFLTGEDMAEVLSLMQILENIFSNSYLRGDDKIAVSVNAEEGGLHAEALNAWSLLLTLLPAGDFVSLINNHTLIPSIKKFIGLFESAHLDVRVAAGEALALMLESGRSHDEEFLEEYLENIVDSVKKLATDSHKYRAKRDRKAQRATFRDVLRFIEEDISPEIKVRFGHVNKESLVLDSWSVNRWYSALCAVTGPGMNCHMQENELLRDIFDLGARPLQDDAAATNNKFTPKQERQLMNAAAFKARSISRGKNRDKRSAVIT